jgi:uncharacterized protein (TIGR02265 family)
MTAVSYGTRETIFAGDARCVFKVQRDFMPPAFHEGVLTAVLRALGALGAHAPRVRGERLGLLDAEYHVEWS